MTKDEAEKIAWAIMRRVGDGREELLAELNELFPKFKWSLEWDGHVCLGIEVVGNDGE